MKSVVDLAKGWFAKADSDLADARRTIASSGPYDTACFHCQQAAEKLLKGFLSFHGQPFPRTHDLEELGRLCEKIDPLLKLTTPDIANLTDFAVKLRYDSEFWPSQQDAAAALTVAELVRSSILNAVPVNVHP